MWPSPSCVSKEVAYSKYQTTLPQSWNASHRPGSGWHLLKNEFGSPFQKSSFHLLHFSVESATMQRITAVRCIDFEMVLQLTLASLWRVFRTLLLPFLELALEADVVFCCYHGRLNGTSEYHWSNSVLTLLIIWKTIISCTPSVQNCRWKCGFWFYVLLEAGVYHADSRKLWRRNEKSHLICTLQSKTMALWGFSTSHHQTWLLLKTW